MSDDLTQKLPGDKEPTALQDDDRISLLIIAVQSLSTIVQSLSTNVQLLSTEVQDVKFRLEALEKTVIERSFETKPIWKRALAEIAATRVELAETRAELKGEIAEVRTELAETRTELRAEMQARFPDVGLKN